MTRLNTPHDLAPNSVDRTQHWRLTDAEVELGQLTDDDALVSSGTAALDVLGDVVQLGRVAKVPR